MPAISIHEFFNIEKHNLVVVLVGLVEAELFIPFPPFILIVSTPQDQKDLLEIDLFTLKKFMISTVSQKLLEYIEPHNVNFAENWKSPLNSTWQHSEFGQKASQM